MSGGTIHPLHFCFATAQPFFELVECQFAGIWVGTPTDFLNLFIGQNDQPVRGRQKILDDPNAADLALAVSNRWLFRR